MARDFKAGDHVSWNSDVGRIRGTVVKKHTSDITFMGHKYNASKDDPRYTVKSDKTDHLAVHTGSALRILPKKT